MKDKILLFINKTVLFVKSLVSRTAPPCKSLKILALAALYLWASALLGAFVGAGFYKMLGFDANFLAIAFLAIPLLMVIPLLIILYLTPFFVLWNLKNAKNTKEKLLSVVGVIFWIIVLAFMTLMYATGITV